MEGKTDIVLCLGSSCFSRGNKVSLQVITEYLKENKLEDKVFFHGHRCFNKCENGPMLKISGQEYENVQPGRVKLLLDNYFKKY